MQDLSGLLPKIPPMRNSQAVLVLCLLAITAPLLAAPGVAPPWSIVFDGPQARESGLEAVTGPTVGHVVVHRAGLEGWRTDRRHGHYKIAVQAPPLPEERSPMPLTVSVEYLDAGHGQWALEYDAVNFEGEPWRTHSRVVRNQASGEWKTASFFLPDAALFSPPTGWWLAVDSFGEMVEQEDLCVRSLLVRLGGVGAVLSAPVVAPGNPLWVHLLARDAQGQPQPGAMVLLRLGTTRLQVGLEHSPPAGLKVSLSAPKQPGLHPVLATLGNRATALPLLVWPGTAAAQIESILVDTAQSPEPWEYWPVAAQADLGSLGGEEGGTRLRYAFTGSYWPGYVDLTRRTTLRGLPLDLKVELKGETHGARLTAILEDATGQRFCYPLGALRWPEWTPVRASLRGPTRSWGGVNDGVMHYPVSFLSLRLLQGPAGSRPSGEVHLRNVFVRTLAP